MVVSDLEVVAEEVVGVAVVMTPALEAFVTFRVVVVVVMVTVVAAVRPAAVVACVVVLLALLLLSLVH